MIIKHCQEERDAICVFVERFAQQFGKSPDKLGPDHLRSYQAYLLKELKLCPGSVEDHVAALRFFFVRAPQSITTVGVRCRHAACVPADGALTRLDRCGISGS